MSPLFAFALTLTPVGQAGSIHDTIPQTELELYLLRDGKPLSDAELYVEGVYFGRTDSQGALIANIPSGRTSFVLRSGDTEHLSLDLLTADRELVLMIITLRDGQEPELVIENSGQKTILFDPNAAPPTDAEAIESGEPSAAQPGALLGTIRSADEDAPVPRALVYFSGTEIERKTDPEGKFEVELPPGIYSLSVVHPRFSAQTLENIRVIPGKSIELTIELTPAGLRLQDYVVTAPYVEGSIASVVEQQREASGVSDVLGAAQIEATGDSNAAEALTRVTGLTVEDGKFVLVRGQPSRFTLALFNGSPLPSPEPLLRVVPLDLFPTGVLSGIEVQKSFSPDQPGAFGAGLIQLNTRGVPDEAFLKLSVSTGYNSISTFEDGRTYQGGSTDYLGLDDGTRALPDEVARATEDGTVSLNALSDDELNTAGQSFSNIFNFDPKKLPADLGIGVTAGTNLELSKDWSFGLVGTTGYSNKWRQQTRTQRTFTLTRGELVPADDLTENRTDNDVSLSGLFTAAVKSNRHEFSLNTFIVNQTQQRSEFSTGQISGSDTQLARRSLLSWIERFLFAQQFIGVHDFDYFQVSYRALYSEARRDAPDRRQFTYTQNAGASSFSIRNPDGLNRSYSFVRDDQISFRLDLTTDQFSDADSSLRIKPSVGAWITEVEREAGEQRFLWTAFFDEDNGIQDPEILFDPSRTGTRLDLRDNSILGADDYTGSSSVTAAYAALDIEISDLFRIVTGLRVEQATVEVETFQLSDDDAQTFDAGFDEDDILPALALTWFALDELQVRAAYGRTLSRPVFNELSTSFFFDPDSGQEFQGNTKLVPTVIDGYDLRIEWYPSETETLTAGAFLKDYTDPLERTFVGQGGGGTLATFQNADSAIVRGFELGGRVELGRLRDWFDGLRNTTILDQIYFGINAAFMRSKVELASQGIATSTVRPLDGQAKMVINAQAGYDSDSHNFTVAYNRVGTRLRRVGIQSQPDIFQDPINSLDVNYRWSFTDSASIKIGGSNLLDARVRLTQQVDGSEPAVFREFRTGWTVNTGFEYTFR